MTYSRNYNLANTYQPKEDQINGFETGLIKYIQSGCFKSYYNKQLSKFKTEISRYGNVIHTIEQRLMNLGLSKAEKTRLTILKDTFLGMMYKLNEEMANYNTRINLVSDIGNQKSHTKPTLRQISYNVLTNFVTNFSNPWERHFTHFHGGSCPIDQSKIYGNEYLCEFGPNPIVAAVVNVLLDVDFNLEMYYSYSGNPQLNYTDFITKLVMNLKDIQSSLPVDQNYFVFNPTPTTCLEAQKLLQENFVQPMQFEPMPTDEQGLYSNVTVGNVNMIRNHSNLAGGN